MTTSDDPIQLTGEEAAGRKLTAVTLQYYADPHIRHFVSNPAQVTPIMNRGYFARVAGTRKALGAFFRCCPPGQPSWFINLGAGLDTIALWVLDSFGGSRAIDVDYDEVIEQKTKAVLRYNGLVEGLAGPDETPQIDAAKGTFDCRRYKLVAEDLRQIDKLEAKIKAIVGADCKAPVIFLSECVVSYMSPTDSDALLRLASRLTSGPRGFVLYEQTRPHDPFGVTMVQNFEARNCPLLSIRRYPSPSSQEERFRNLGWDAAEARDMNQIYDEHLDRQDVLRIQRLELLDELEELRLLQTHYLILSAAAGMQDAQEQWKEYLELLQNPLPPEPAPRFTTDQLRDRNSSRM